MPRHSRSKIILKVFLKVILQVWIFYFIFISIVKRLQKYKFISLYRFITFRSRVFPPLVYKALTNNLPIAMSEQQNGFTKSQQYVRVTTLGVCFMLMFTSFNSLQNIVSKLYDDYGYQNLGQTALLSLYFTFGIATCFTTYIIKHVGYKKTMFFSSIGYAIFQATGLLIVTQIQISHTLVWIIINIGACICGFSASALWVAQGAYTSRVASDKRKNELFGLFWALMMSSQILGNLLSTFVLGRINNLVYFIILTIIGGLTATLFLFLPDVQAKSESQQVNFKQQVRKVFTIIKDKKYIFIKIRYIYLNIYFLFPGLAVAFYAGYLYKFIVLSLPKQDGQIKGDYARRVNEHAGYVFFTLGLSQIFTGLMMNRFAERFNKFNLAIVGTLLVQVAAFVSFVCYYLKSYPLCFAAAFLWGGAQTFLQTNTGGLIAQIFPGKMQGFSVYRIFFACGFVSIQLINIALSKCDPYIFLTIILALQSIMTAVSLNLRYLDVPSKQTLLIKEKQEKNQPGQIKESLLSRQQGKNDENEDLT